MRIFLCVKKEFNVFLAHVPVMEINCHTTYSHVKEKSTWEKGKDGSNNKKVAKINFNPNLHVCSFAYLLVDNNNKAYLKSITHLF